MKLSPPQSRFAIKTIFSLFFVIYAFVGSKTIHLTGVVFSDEVGSMHDLVFLIGNSNPVREDLCFQASANKMDLNKSEMVPTLQIRQFFANNENGL